MVLLIFTSSVQLTHADNILDDMSDSEVLESMAFIPAAYSALYIDADDLEVQDFVHTLGDAHLYHNHFEQVKEQLTRSPLASPKLKILRKPDSIFDYKFEDFEIEGYEAHAHIKAPVAV